MEICTMNFKQNQNWFFTSICLLPLLLSFTYQNQSIRQKHFNIENGVAIEGYDPVAYHISGKAIKGNNQFAVNADGVVYHCSSKSNKDLFIANYKKYEPQYGGWCAYAMGNSGEKVKINPQTYKIKDGKLYLFYNALFNNTLNSWNENETTLRNNADKNWTKLFK